MRDLIEQDSLDSYLSKIRLYLLQNMRRTAIRYQKEKDKIKKDDILRTVRKYGEVTSEIKSLLDKNK